MVAAVPGTTLQWIKKAGLHSTNPVARFIASGIRINNGARMAARHMLITSASSAIGAALAVYYARPEARLGNWIIRGAPR